MFKKQMNWTDTGQKSVHLTINGDSLKKLQEMQKCLMHAVALNEKALIPIVPKKKRKQNKNTEKPTHLTALHLKMHHTEFVYNSTEFQKSKGNKAGILKI